MYTSMDVGQLLQRVGPGLAITKRQLCACRVTTYGQQGLRVCKALRLGCAQHVYTHGVHTVCIQHTYLEVLTSIAT
jgi:hypothetical protein